MNREKLFKNLEKRYLSKRDMISRIPLGVNPDSLWQELLNLRRSSSTVLPLYSCNGKPYWYVTTEKMVTSSEKIVEALFENETEHDPYAEPLPVMTLEEVFFTGYIEGAQITLQAAMDFLTGEQPPRDIEEQLIVNNRMAGSYASENIYRPIDADFMRELIGILTDGMDTGGQDYRFTDETDYISADGERLQFPPPHVIPERIDALCGFLNEQNVHPLIKAAIAQAYLIVTRPFPEGNERLGRILSCMILLRSGYSFFSDVSLSALIARRSYAYYEAAANILREENEGDMTYFVEYYLELLSRAVDERRLRIQNAENEVRQAEIEMARTTLSPPSHTGPPGNMTAKDSASVKEPEVTPNESQLREANEFPDGFHTVSSNEPELSFDNSDSGNISLGRIRDRLYDMVNGRGKTSKKCAMVLINLFDDGIYSFTSNDIAVLNFASATNPGGGVTRGSSAQEEALCRCSTLFPTLNQKPMWDQFYSINRAEKNVLHTDACIYSPNITVFKDDSSIPRMMPPEEWFSVDVISCAAPNLRNIVSNAYNPESGEAVHLSAGELYQIHIQRARHILTIAAANKVDVLVLGAFGCGAFANDPRVVADATFDALEEFINCFDMVEFAIYCRKYETENYDAFLQTYERRTV